MNLKSLRELLADILLGVRCPVCSERHRNMSFHVRFDHPDHDGWWSL